MTADEIMAWVEANTAETASTKRVVERQQGITFAEIPAAEKKSDKNPGGYALGEGQDDTAVVAYKTVTDVKKVARVAIPSLGIVGEGETIADAIESIRAKVREIAASVGA